MKTKTNRACYKNKAIRTLDALAKALGTTVENLRRLAGSADRLYREAKSVVKNDGTLRQTFDAHPPLKQLHRKIKTRIFANVNFPKYLTGSLRGTDYQVNAALHTQAKIVICEDIESFFPSTSIDRVCRIWSHFFRFSDDVAELLARLTTKDGALPQGAITSSYLANLAFYDEEPRLQENFSASGIVYSRYVDDITISSTTFLDTNQQSKAIAKIYGMLKQCGYKAKRRKHEVFTDGRRMFTTKLLVNKRPALPQAERAKIRTAVHQLEQSFSFKNASSRFRRELDNVSGRVGTLCRFHPREGAALRARISRIRKCMEV